MTFELFTLFNTTQNLVLVEPLSKFYVFRFFLETYKNGLRHVLALTPSNDTYIDSVYSYFLSDLSSNRQRNHFITVIDILRIIYVIRTDSINHRF